MKDFKISFEGKKERKSRRREKRPKALCEVLNDELEMELNFSEAQGWNLNLKKF